MYKAYKANLLFLVIIISFFSSCKDDKKFVDFNHFDKKADTISIDFSHNNFDLIKSVEKHSKVSLCDEKYRLGIFELENSRYIFPVILDKFCENDAIVHNIIDIIINQNNQILVESELVVNDISLKDKVLRHSKERLDAKNYKGLLFNFSWIEKLDKETNKENLVEILKGIDLVLDYKSNQLFGKSLKHLNKKELEKLNSEFYANLLIADYDPIINQPPPKQFGNDSIMKFSL